MTIEVEDRSALAVARYICAKVRARGGEIDRTKLQCLLYFAQAASIAWHGRTLFRDDIYAGRDHPRIIAIDKASRRACGLDPA